MSDILMVELFKSRTRTHGSSPGCEVRYSLSGSDDDEELHDYLDENAPATYGIFWISETSLEKAEGENLWTGIVKYGPAQWSTPLQTEGEEEFEFDTGGGSQKITQSIATIANYAPGSETAPVFKGAIGCTDDSVEGADIVVPIYRFGNSVLLSSARVTSSYKDTLFALTGCVNNGGFGTLAAGECLFLGASGRQRNSGLWQIKYSFASSPNQTGITIGDMTGISKKGWEYLWVRYRTDVFAGPPKKIIKVPTSAHVEQVYRYGNFGLI